MILCGMNFTGAPGPSILFLTISRYNRAMADHRTPFALAFVKGLLGSSLLFAWGGALIWWAGEPIPGDPELEMQRFSLIATGMVLIALGVIGMLYSILKSRAPTRQKDRPTEAAEMVFDPDAAMARYLAQRQPDAAAGAPENSELPVRPVFGRRGAAPSPHE